MDTKDNGVVHEQSDEDSNNVINGTSITITDQPGTNANTNTTNTSSGLQQIEDDTDGLPLPTGAAEEISNRAEPPKQIDKVEQIEDDDLGPEPPSAMLEASLNAADPEVVSKTSATIPNSLSSVNDEHSPPTPFNSANFEQDNIAKKIAKDEMNQKPAALSDTNEEEKRVIPLVEESVNIPTSEHIESMDEIRGITNTNTGSNNGRGWEDIESRVARDIESQTNTDVNDSEGSINMIHWLVQKTM